MIRSFSPALMRELKLSRLDPGLALARTGFGARRSRDLGPGIEFEDYREYAAGDDARRVDPHVFSRTGHAVVRQYAQERQLHVTVVLDASLSMVSPTPAKLSRGKEMAAVFAVVALNNEDTIQLVVGDGDGVHAHRRMATSADDSTLSDSLAALDGAGVLDLRAAASTLANILPPYGLVILISDLLGDGIVNNLPKLLSHQRDVIAIHIVDPEDATPRFLSSPGSVQLVDCETGVKHSLNVDDVTPAAYREEWGKWQAELRSEVQAAGGRWCEVRTDTDLLRTVVPDLRRYRVIQ